MVQNMPYDKQRKGCFIKESSDDEDDRDDKYDSGIFHDRMHKICVALNKEKDVGLTQALSDDEDDKDDDLITPYIFQDFRSQNAVTTAEPPF